MFDDVVEQLSTRNILHYHEDVGGRADYLKIKGQIFWKKNKLLITIEFQ